MRLHQRGLPAVASSLLLALPLALAGCTSFGESSDEPAATSTAPAEPEAAPIEWRDCGAPMQPPIAGQPRSGRDLPFEGGTTAARVSYDEPARGTLPPFPLSPL